MNTMFKILKKLSQWEPCDNCGKWCWGKCTDFNEFPMH